MQINTDGLIIREQSIGESDRLVTVLTREQGILRAFVRGAKAMKSRSASSTQLLCYSRLSIYEGREKYIIDEAEPIEVFFSLRTDFEKLSLAQYFCELALALAPEKDIDGITDDSLAGVFTNTDLGYAPCTAQACLEILKYYNIPLSGRRAVVVGRSLVVGKPAAMMLDRENATVTICNSRTQNLPAICKEADVVVVAMGKMGAVGADCLREGQTVVDVGIHVNEKGKLCGDVKFSEAEPVVDAITPVPGGVGTVTTSVLVGHVVQAAAKKAGL